MSDLGQVLALAAVPALGNFAGGVAAEVFPASRRVLSYALHMAAGIVLAVVAVELLPRALASVPAWQVIAAFAAGGMLFFAADAALEIARSRAGRGGGSGGPWLIYFGVTVDLFSDGVMIGAGTLIDFRLGLLLALGQIIADVPEGFATVAGLRSAGLSRGRRLLLSALFIVPVLLGGALGYLALRDAPLTARYALLVLTAGVLLAVAVEEMLPEAHEQHECRFATLCLVGGFVLFMAVSQYLA